MSAGMQGIHSAPEHLLLMGEQDNAATSYSVGPAVCGALGWKDFAYSSTAATAAPLSSKRYISVSCGFACLEGKMGFWVFRKSENTRGLVLCQTCLWGASGSGPIRMSWKVSMASLRSYLVPVVRFSGKWFCSLPMYTWHTQTWWCKVTARAQLLLSPIGSYTDMQLPAKTRMSDPNHVKIVISSPSHLSEGGSGGIFKSSTC